MTSLKFLQFSDLHFGSRLSESRLGLTLEQLETRRAEFRRTVRDVFTLAVARQVDVVLAPGDLWDTEEFSSEAYHYLLDCVSLLQGIPLVITPGNHDYYSLKSYYHPDFLKSKGFEPWPENVVIFNAPSFTTHTLPGRPDIRVTGCAFQGNVQVDERMLSSLSPMSPEAGTFHLLLFHGSRVDGLPPGGRKMLTAPFSVAELSALNYDYAAVGHYHRMEAFTAPSGRIVGAYAGCTFGRGLDETGPKGVLLGEIVKTAGEPQVRLEHIPLDPRKIVMAEADITGCHHLEALQSTIESQLSGASPEITPEDLVICTLKGTLTPSLSGEYATLQETLEARLSASFFFIRLEARTLAPREPFRASELSEDDLSLEARFSRTLQDKLSETEDPRTKAVLENAMKYGYHALMNHQIEMIYEI